MVSRTFENLKTIKQDQIYAALVAEFTNYSLVDAQVARIIKRAEISRGSFYAYFDDMNDAYRWVFGQIIKNVHGHRDFSSLVEIVENDQDTYKFLQKYYQINEQYLALHDEQFAKTLAPRLLSEDASDIEVKMWLGMITGHDLMRKFFLFPEKQKEIGETYKKISDWLS